MEYNYIRYFTIEIPEEGMKLLKLGEDMKKVMYGYPIKIIVLFMLISITSCTTGRGLIKDEVRTDIITGTFTVILYGARFSNDLENVAILDVEGDRYKIEIFAPDFDYRVKTGVPAGEAVRMAERFIAFHPSFKYPQVVQIKDPEGVVIGYEFRPLYSPSEFGFFDVLDIHYRLKDDKVIVKIELVPEIRQPLFFDNTSSSSE